MPAEVVINLEGGPHHQNFRPRFAADRLGRVPQRVIRRQIVEADDFQRNREDDQPEAGCHQPGDAQPGDVAG